MNLIEKLVSKGLVSMDVLNIQQALALAYETGYDIGKILGATYVLKHDGDALFNERRKGTLIYCLRDASWSILAVNVEEIPPEFSGDRLERINHNRYGGLYRRDEAPLNAGRLAVPIQENIKKYVNNGYHIMVANNRIMQRYTFNHNVKITQTFMRNLLERFGNENYRRMLGSLPPSVHDQLADGLDSTVLNLQLGSVLYLHTMKSSSRRVCEPILRILNVPSALGVIEGYGLMITGGALEIAPIVALPLINILRQDDEEVDGQQLRNSLAGAGHTLFSRMGSSFEKVAMNPPGTLVKVLQRTVAPINWDRVMLEPMSLRDGINTISGGRLSIAKNDDMLAAWQREMMDAHQIRPYINDQVDDTEVMLDGMLMFYPTARARGRDRYDTTATAAHFATTDTTATAPPGIRLDTPRFRPEDVLPPHETPERFLELRALLHDRMTVTNTTQETLTRDARGRIDVPINIEITRYARVPRPTQGGFDIIPLSEQAYHDLRQQARRGNPNWGHPRAEFLYTLVTSGNRDHGFVHDVPVLIRGALRRGLVSLEEVIRAATRQLICFYHNTEDHGFRGIVEVLTVRPQGIDE